MGRVWNPSPPQCKAVVLSVTHHTVARVNTVIHTDTQFIVNIKAIIKETQPNILLSYCNIPADKPTNRQTVKQMDCIFRNQYFHVKEDHWIGFKTQTKVLYMNFFCGLTDRPTDESMLIIEKNLHKKESGSFF